MDLEMAIHNDPYATAAPISSVLSWISPVLVRAGIKAEPWWPEAMAKVEPKWKCAPRMERITAGFFALSHPMAWQYLEQAPILALSYRNENREGSMYAVDGINTTIMVGAALKELPTLRDLMDARGMAYPLRKLQPACLMFHAMPGYSMCLNVNQSTLSQSVPDDPHEQVRWANLVDAFWQNISRPRPAPLGESFDGINAAMLEWFLRLVRPLMQEFAKNTVGQPTAHVATSMIVTTVADFLSRGGVKFDPTWSWKGASDRADEWHKRIALQSAEEQFFTEYGVNFDQEVDHHDMPSKQTIGNYDFIALRSGKALFEEGAAMGHCVASYAAEVIRGGSRIYSIRDKNTGERLATVEYRISKGGGGAQYETVDLVNGDRMNVRVQDAPTETYISLAQIQAPHVRKPPAPPVMEAAELFIYDKSKDRPSLGESYNWPRPERFRRG